MDRALWFLGIDMIIRTAKHLQRLQTNRANLRRELRRLDSAIKDARKDLKILTAMAKEVGE